MAGKVIRLGSQELQLTVNKRDEPVARFGSREVRQVQAMSEDLKGKLKEYPSAYARVLAFLELEGQFDVLTNAEEIADYQRSYRDQISSEKSPAAVSRGGLLDSGEFAVGEINLPMIEENRLVFYAREVHTGLPYRIEVPLGGGAQLDIQIKPIQFA